MIILLTLIFAVETWAKKPPPPQRLNLVMPFERIRDREDIKADAECKPLEENELKKICDNWQIKCQDKNIYQLGVAYLPYAYCHKNVASSVDQAFLPDYDVPAKFISYYTEDYLKDRYDRGHHRDFYREYEIAAFESLNVEAATTWKAMSDCFGGNDELARQAFITGDYQCVAGQDGELVHLQVSALFENVRLYMLSSGTAGNGIEIKSLKYRRSMTSRQRIMEPVQDLYRNLYGNKSDPWPVKIPDLHPLVAQILGQLYADFLFVGAPYMSFQQLSYAHLKSGLGASLDRLVFFGNAVSNWQINAANSSMGLWPTASRSLWISIYDRMSEIEDRYEHGYNGRYAFANTSGGFLPPVYRDSRHEIAKRMMASTRHYLPGFKRPPVPKLDKRDYEVQLVKSMKFDDLVSMWFDFDFKVNQVTRSHLDIIIFYIEGNQGQFKDQMKVMPDGFKHRGANGFTVQVFALKAFNDFVNGNGKSWSGRKLSSSGREFFRSRLRQEIALIKKSSFAAGGANAGEPVSQIAYEKAVEALKHL